MAAESSDRSQAGHVLGDKMDTGTSQATPQLQHDKSRFKLRHVKFRNFVKFEDEQELEFERNGVYFLLGQNQSGKTSVLEAIRRCLSLRYSSSFSSRPKPGKESVIVTRYKDDYGKALLAFCMYMRECKGSDIDVCLKGCAIFDKDNTTPNRLELDVVPLKFGKVVSKQVDLLSADKAGFPSACQVSLDDFKNWIRKQYESKCPLSEIKPEMKDLNSQCEQLLKQHLEGVVFAFPMRGIGSTQWNKSEKIHKHSNNYIEANNNAEIIMWYLKRCDKMNGEGTNETNDNEKLKEEDYFDVITNSRGGKYELLHRKNSTQIVVKKDESKPLSILKQSEGFVEAKLCSILLSVEDFTTVSIEDPGTGMHPQMIDRLCLIMTERVKDRVVIVPTHNANFLKPWLLDRMFYFKRTHSGLFKIASGKSLSENKDLKAAIPGSVTSEQFANFCYAETIVFVEGISDQLFMEALARLILRSDNNYYPLLSGIQFVNMGGQGKVQHFRKCCKLLNKRFAFIIDNDSKSKTLRPLKKTISDELQEALGKDPRTTNISEFEKANEDRLRQTYLAEEEMYFFWNGKDLEIVFWNMLDLLKPHGVKFNGNMKAVIEACFRQFVSIDAVENDSTDEAGGPDIDNVENDSTDEAGGPDIDAVENDSTDEAGGPEIDDVENDSTAEAGGLNRFEITKVTTPPKKPKFKLFIHGVETFEQRVDLIQFFLQQATLLESEVGSKLDITRIHEFLKSICKG